MDVKKLVRQVGFANSENKSKLPKKFELLPRPQIELSKFLLKPSIKFYVSTKFLLFEDCFTKIQQKKCNFINVLSKTRGSNPKRLRFFYEFWIWVAEFLTENDRLI